MKESAVRRLQVAFLAITLFSIAQVVWWIYDQSRYSGEQVTDRMELYREQAEAAREMLDAGIGRRQVEAVFPGVEVLPDLRVEVRSATLEALHEERRAHLNQYRWEGAFFLFVLLAAIWVVWRALRRDFQLRRWQDNFLAAVSHELKSPLASVQLAAETLALRDLAPERRAQVVGRILADAKRLGVTINNVLDTHRLDRGETVHSREALAIGAIALQVVDDVEFRAAEAGIGIELTIPQHAVVLADALSVRSVLRNLLDNAIKAHTVRQDVASHNGEGWTAEGSRIEVTATLTADEVTVEVRDQGIGFPAEESERIFAKFYRLGNELRRTATGSGLGLHLARGLVELDGGTLRAHSDGRGHGATFTAVWPRDTTSTADRPG